MKMKIRLTRSLFLLLFCTSLFLSSSEILLANNNVFPVYETIKPNVYFWKMIYTQYHSRQGVIHDTHNLDIIYEIVDLVPHKKRKSRRINARKIKTAKKKYRKILEKLAKGGVPLSKEEIRVSALFGENTDPAIFNESRESIRFQRGQKDRFREGLIRSGKYIEQIKGIFRKHNLPEDLAFLPHVESSFNYKAYSKFGAAGIWQFTYGTGKQFMNVNYTVDERRDPIRSSYAAARLLKQNYSKLGNWALAITAYNHGVNSMLRAQKTNGNYETIFKEYNGRRFKFASKNFYSEFLAASEIAKNSHKYFGPLQVMKPELTGEIKMPGYAPVSGMAKHFGISVKTLKKMNPALRNPIFRGQKLIPKGYRLRLPASDNFKAKTSELVPAMFKPKQKRSRFYWVRKGDVAGIVARRHGITLRDLIRANNLNHRATIYAGQNLRIPTQQDSVRLAKKYAKKKQSFNQHASKMKNHVKLKANSDHPSPLSEKTNINPSIVMGDLMVKKVFKRKGQVFGTIRVNTRETIGHYAEWSNYSAQRLRRLNGFSFEKSIRYNERIVIPLNRIGKDRFEEKRYEYHKEFEEDFLNAYSIKNVWIYEIKSGDSIWKLCKNDFELPFWLIKKYNTAIDFARLKPSQKLVVPIVEKNSKKEL